MLCPCGSTVSFNECCEKFINKQQQTITAEQLMRSRYSAYATTNAHYIFATYATQSQSEHSIADIQAWTKQCRWLSLEILATDVAQQTVEFIATYIHGKTLFQLHEVSRFIKENEQWRYLDYRHFQQQKIATLSRNDLCPCQSGKKFKQCCARLSG